MWLKTSPTLVSVCAGGRTSVRVCAYVRVCVCTCIRVLVHVGARPFGPAVAGTQANLSKGLSSAARVPSEARTTFSQIGCRLGGRDLSWLTGFTLV